MTGLPVRPQSGFVTVLAWTMLLFNGFAVFGSLMQNVAIGLFLPDITISGVDLDASPISLPMGLVRAVGIVGFVFSLVMVWSAWALLQRREWARRLYVWTFVLGIVVNVLSGIAFWLGARAVDPALLAGPQAAAQVRAIMQGMTVFVAMLVVVLSLVYAWLAKRLNSPEIRAEFAAAGEAR